MPTVEGAGVEIAYDETIPTHPSGPAVVLVHGMAADHTAWDPVPGARAIAYDRRGYGGSGAPEPYTATTVAEQAEDLAALLSAVDARPALGVGADFGALVVLDVALRHPGALRAAVLVDPPLFQLVDALEPLAAERAALEQALRDGGQARAVEVWLTAHGVSDPGRLEVAQRDAPAFFADYSGQATLSVTRRELRSLALPVAVLDSPHASAHARAASDAVAALLPDARRGGSLSDALSL